MAIVIMMLSDMQEEGGPGQKPNSLCTHILPETYPGTCQRHAYGRPGRPSACMTPPVDPRWSVGDWVMAVLDGPLRTRRPENPYGRGRGPGDGRPGRPPLYNAHPTYNGGTPVGGSERTSATISTTR